MKQINIDQLIRAQILRDQQKDITRIAAKLTRKGNRKKKSSTLSTYTLFISGSPSEEQREMEHLEAVVMNRAIRAKFCDHVRDCLDKGIQNEEKLSEWRCTHYWRDKDNEVRKP